jgi:wobble nucleotide-excising tRNase
LHTVSNLIISYLKIHRANLCSQILSTATDDHILITCYYDDCNMKIYVYNDTFIKLKVNNMPYAICDGIKTFRSEIDRLHMLRYQ